MHVVHIIAGIWRHTGGPAEVVPRLCAGLAEHGCRVTLMTLDGAHSEAALECAKRGVDFRSYPVIGNHGIWFSPKMSRDLRLVSQEADVIHDHGMWLYPNWVATKWSQRHNKPLMITPHGVLTRGMLKRSRLKKAIAWTLFDRHSVKHAAVLQAFSNAELLQMKTRIKGKKVAVIPNGVDLWELPHKAAFRQRFPQVQGRKILLFLARVHPIKGVFDLLEAWKILSCKYPQWHLAIVGRPEAECIGKFESRIPEYNLESSVTLTGPQYGQERLQAYAAADAFVLPSYAEGFSTSILEAMACRLPLVYTEQCNFPEAAQHGAGYVGGTGVEALVHNLGILFRLTDVERRNMGEKGYQLIQKEYVWPRIAKKMMMTYEWLVGSGSTPKWVVTA